MKTNKTKPSILPGFMELLPNKQRIFNDMVSRITKVYESNGFLPMDTPIIEKSEVLLAKSQGETSKEIYRFMKGGSDLALRFDLTVPFARYVAQYQNELIFPFKRYQMGKVYRGEKNQKGRYREFYQCDLDIVGKEKLSIQNDAFVISVIDKAFKSIGLTQYQFQLSNRKIMIGLLEGLQVKQINEVLVLIDKYDKIGEAAFKASLETYVSEAVSGLLLQLFSLSGESEKQIETLEALKIDNELLRQGIEELQVVIKSLQIFGVKPDNYAINFKIIRGLDYYTGTIFETFLTGYESYGSVCSGGRYDNLAENYTDQKMPGVGISIGLTRLFFILEEIGFTQGYTMEPVVDYLIIPIGDTLGYCQEVSELLREAGMKVEIYLEEDKMKKKLGYADKRGIEKVLLIGEEEVEKEEVLLKDMITGEQTTLSKNFL